MAGPWFVDCDNGLTSNTGLSPTSPWKFPPSSLNALSTSQSGYGVVAGDTINILNGSTYDANTYGPLRPPAANLTYRGYGKASNVLTLLIPSQYAPWQLTLLPVARQWGTHEGMWRIEASASDVASGAAINTNTAAGCTFEDVEISGPLINSRDAVGAGASGTNANGFTLRRSRIRNSARRGISCYNLNPVIEYVDVGYTVDDNIGLMCSVANGDRAGSTATLRYINFRDPDRLKAGDPQVTVSPQGDCLQTVVNGPTSASYKEVLNVSDFYAYKSTTGKQCFTLVDANAGITVERGHVTGGGACQFNFGNLTGTVRVRNIYFGDVFGTSDNMLFRFEGIQAPTMLYLMETGSVLDISNIYVNSPRFPGLFHTIDGTVATPWEVRGTVNLTNITVMRTTNDNGFTGFASNVALWSASTGITWGTAGRFNLRNVNLQAFGKPQVILPTGTAGDTRFVITGNCFDPAATFLIGTTPYADLAAFQAAHAPASGNVAASAQVDPGGRPLPGSPLVGGGTDLGPRRGINGVQSRKFIGAFGPGFTRNV